MMDKQREQTNQNPNQEVEYTSGFLNEDEEVNESEFDEPTGEQEADKLADNQQKKKVKRPRKTIEQEIAELDAKRERLMEKKRRQDAHEKIVFGGVVIALLKDLQKSNNPEAIKIIDLIINFTKQNNNRDMDIIKSLTDRIKNKF